MEQNERNDRLEKLRKLREKGIVAYADRFDRSHTLAEARETAAGTPVRVAGRIVLMRVMGKIVFAHLKDQSGKMQAVFKADDLTEEMFKLLELADIGDIVGVSGTIFVTKKGEISVLVNEFAILTKALRPLPEKWHGLQDVEKKYRQRYLDLIANDDTRKRFEFRSRFLWELRKFYAENGFLEVETPILQTTASGALAKPFQTHHNDFNEDFYLRIAPEIYLKEAIIGGFEKIFEIGKSFRNEGSDPSHLQEFTTVEHYAAYWNFEDNMQFTEKLLTAVLTNLLGALKVEIPNKEGDLKEIDFTPPWPTTTFSGLLKKDAGLEIEKMDKEDIRAKAKEMDIEIEKIETLGRGNLLDAIYKKVSRPKIAGPMFIVGQPKDISPLARSNDTNPSITDRFQLVVSGWEIVNGYSELSDPVEQKNRFDEQQKARSGGDEEAMMKDDEFITALEHGLPPTSGLGMGIDRIISLLTKQHNLRDVVLFPLMKPE